MGAPIYSRWVNQGAFSLLDRVMTAGFGFLNVVFMFRIISKDQIGVWVLFASVTSFLEMVRAGFIRNPFVTYMVSAEEHEKTSIITSSLALHGIIALSTSIFLIVLAIPLSSFWHASGLDKLFFVYAVHTILLIPCLHFEYLQTTRLQFGGIFVCNFVRLIIPAGFVFICFVLDRKETTVLEIAYVQVLATIAGTFVAYPYVRDLVKIDRVVNRKLVSELFHFGKFTFGTSVSSMFVRNTDSWMIGRMLTTAAVASYSPAIRLANLFEVPTLAISNFIFPQVGQKMKERGKEGIKDIYEKSVSLMLALSFPIVIPMFIFAPYFVELIFGAEYMEAAPILRVTIFYSLIIPFNRQFGTIMDGLKRPKLNFYLLVMVAVLNVIFNYIFLKMFGLIGCAYGSLLSYCVVFIINQAILYHEFKINTVRIFGSMFFWYKEAWNIFAMKLTQVIK